jgi:hypothetical protein
MKFYALEAGATVEKVFFLLLRGNLKSFHAKKEAQEAFDDEVN